MKHLSKISTPEFAQDNSNYADIYASLAEIIQILSSEPFAGLFTTPMPELFRDFTEKKIGFYD